MTTDTLSRRKRTDIQPTGKDVELNEGVLDLLEGIRRYHPLPPKIAFGFWSGGNHYPTFQNKLTDLTHERPDGMEPVLVRPEYFNPRGIKNYEPIWYDLSERGYRITRGQAFHPLEVPERDHLKHRAFNACVGASLELLAPSHMRHIHLEEIIAHPNCPALTKEAKNPLRIPLSRDHYIEGDRLMGFQHPEGFRWYAIEVDRATETNIRTVYEKLDNWLYVLNRQVYRSFYGFKGTAFKIMFITTAPGRMQSYLDYLKGKPGGECFLFKALPDFGVHWRAPREPLKELFEPWLTTAGAFDITKR